MTLIVHGNGSHSWLSLVSTAAEHTDGILRGAIEHALQINYP